MQNDRVELVRADGSTVFSTLPAWLRDAHGTTRWLAPRVSNEPGSATMSIDLDFEGLFFPVLVDPAWSSVAASNKRRASLITLPSGKVLGLAGPDDPYGAELYDPLANTWTTVGSSTLVHSSTIAQPLPSGKILLVDNGPSIATLEVFDPANNTFATIAGPGGYATNRRGLAPASGGRTLLLDSSGPRVLVYTEATATWTGPYSYTGGINSSATVHLGSGKLLSAGGDTAGYPFSAAEIFDGATLSWSTMAPMSTAE